MILTPSERKLYLQIGAGLVVLGLFGSALLSYLSGVDPMLSTREAVARAEHLLPRISLACGIVASILLLAAWSNRSDKIGRVSLMFFWWNLPIVGMWAALVISQDTR